MSLTVREVYALARSAGLGHSQAVTATAIAMAESGLRPDAVGDVGLQDATWGPSIGLWQIRSLKADTGTGRARDASRLSDPAFNARAMFSISRGGTTWSPWSVFKSNAYAGNVSEVTGAVGTGSGISAPTPSGAASTVPAGDWDPLPGGGGAPGYLDDLFGLDDDISKSTPSNPADALVDAVGRTMLLAVGVGLGVTLVAAGAWRAVSKP